MYVTNSPRRVQVEVPLEVLVHDDGARRHGARSGGCVGGDGEGKKPR